MKILKINRPLLQMIITIIISVVMVGCATQSQLTDEPFPFDGQSPLYLIGPGDSVNVFIWGNSELSTTVSVRPDGRITTPLIEDVPASGKTPTELARDMEVLLAKYIKNPVVTVIVSGFVGRYSEQIRVVGEATEPQAIPYREQITLLDLMIEVGGMTEFASGNNASIIRVVDGEQRQFTVLLDDLIKNGDITANVAMLPGDILIIPEAWF